MLFLRHISPLDIYTYLNGRFGPPNGFIWLIKSDSSDNLIHWDYLVKADDHYIYIMDFTRQVQIFLDIKLTDQQWLMLVTNLRLSYSKFAQQKSRSLGRLEKWTIFVNKFVSLSSIAATHHARIDDYLSNPHIWPSPPRNEKDYENWYNSAQDFVKQQSALHESCLFLRLLTPVIAESFLNLIILIACRREIRTDAGEYQQRVRSHIDEKVRTLHITCDHFKHPVDLRSTAYKNFKRIMDDRNWFIHGNADPTRDKIETVYFDSKIPIYKLAGDINQQFFDAVNAELRPEKILKDYVNMHEFAGYVIECMDHQAQYEIWQVIQAQSIGYDKKRSKFGTLFGDYIVSSILPGIRYDTSISGDDSSA